MAHPCIWDTVLYGRYQRTTFISGRAHRALPRFNRNGRNKSADRDAKIASARMASSPIDLILGVSKLTPQRFQQLVDGQANHPRNAGDPLDVHASGFIEGGRMPLLIPMIFPTSWCMPGTVQQWRTMGEGMADACRHKATASVA